MPPTVVDGIADRYARILESYIENRTEMFLSRAYELGRQALADGLSLLDLARIHHAAVANVQVDNGTNRGRADSVPGTGHLLAEYVLMEALSPYEMAHLGYQAANASLREALARQERMKEALLRVNDLLEGEARRVAHALHDEAGQLLATVHVALETATRELPENLRGSFRTIPVLLDEIESGLRRLSHELRPTVLDRLGLIPALEFLLEGAAWRMSFPVVMRHRLRGRLSSPVETAIYRVVQEALTNIGRHARAHHASIFLEERKGDVRCVVSDDGVGFDFEGFDTLRAGDGLGLLGIHERVQSVNGNVEIVSARGFGTELTVTVPAENGRTKTR